MSNIIKLSLSSSYDFPILLLYGVVMLDDKVEVELPHYYPYIGEWGFRLNEIGPVAIRNGKFKFRFLWYSIYEDLFYKYEKLIDISSKCDTEILWGFKSYGEVACWEYSDFKSNLIGIDYATSLDSEQSKYLKRDPAISKLLDPNYLSFQELKESYDKFLDVQYGDVVNNFNAKLINLIHKYNYKYNCQILYYGIDIGNFDLSVKYFDGSFNKNEQENMARSSSLSIPQRLNIRCAINSMDFQFCFFLEFESVKKIFEKFYGAHPETKTDFIIRIDAENKKYELALYRQGLKEPVVIPESAYQLIVFKNKFEDYRSENYKQPRGAWIW